MMALLTNERPVFRPQDLSWPMRGYFWLMESEEGVAMCALLRCILQACLVGEILPHSSQLTPCWMCLSMWFSITWPMGYQSLCNMTRIDQWEAIITCLVGVSYPQSAHWYFVSALIIFIAIVAFSSSADICNDPERESFEDFWLHLVKCEINMRAINFYFMYSHFI